MYTTFKGNNKMETQHELCPYCRTIAYPLLSIYCGISKRLLSDHFLTIYHEIRRVNSLFYTQISALFRVRIYSSPETCTTPCKCIEILWHFYTRYLSLEEAMRANTFRFPCTADNLFEFLRSEIAAINNALFRVLSSFWMCRYSALVHGKLLCNGCHFRVSPHIKRFDYLRWRLHDTCVALYDRKRPLKERTGYLCLVYQMLVHEFGETHARLFGSALLCTKCAVQMGQMSFGFEMIQANTRVITLKISRFLASEVAAAQQRPPV